MAKTASAQLAFERQELPPDYIKSDYWEAPVDNLLQSGSGSNEEKSVNRRGLTGSARLLQDIYQLDQYAFSTDKRKLELTKTISLAAMAPAEFQRFKETGELTFETSMKVFDRDFPGHYLRLIRKVSTSVIALIPPVEGIKATLSNAGISYTVIEGANFQKVPVVRPPESVALTAAANATGLFEMSQVGNEKLFPFEHTGVETTWNFSMPKASNRFDYSSIADVLITIEYTALHSDIYKAQVTGELGTEFKAERAFSFRNQFPDQWYDLNNSATVAEQDRMKVNFSTTRADFPANLSDISIDQLVLFFIKADGLSEADSTAVDTMKVKGLSFAPQNKPVLGYQDGKFTSEATAREAIISTRKTNGSNWLQLLDGGNNGEGTWTLAFDEEARGYFEQEKITDIIFVLSYSAQTPEWPK